MKIEDIKPIEPVRTVEEQPKNNGKPFVKGDPRINRNGRPPGSLDFKTKWLIFIDKIAKQNGITTDEVDDQMLTVAYKQMQSGDYRYWKDIQDRVHGTAVQKGEISVRQPSPLVEVEEKK